MAEKRALQAGDIVKDPDGSQFFVKAVLEDGLIEVRTVVNRATTFLDISELTFIREATDEELA